MADSLTPSKCAGKMTPTLPAVRLCSPTDLDSNLASQLWSLMIERAWASCFIYLTRSIFIHQTDDAASLTGFLRASIRKYIYVKHLASHRVNEKEQRKWREGRRGQRAPSRS